MVRFIIFTSTWALFGVHVLLHLPAPFGINIVDLSERHHFSTFRYQSAGLPACFVDVPVTVVVVFLVFPLGADFYDPPLPPLPPPLHFILLYIISYVAPPPSCGPSWLPGSSASQAVLLLHALYVSLGCLLCVWPAFSDLYAPLAFCFPFFLS